MKADTVLTLTPLDAAGNALEPFFFSNTEVPEEIAFGGEQALAVHQLIGGARVVDAMGRLDRPLAWRGIFVGSDADQRARYLDHVRASGYKCLLTWWQYSYTVALQEFLPTWQRFYQIPYSISCLVIQDNTRPITTPPIAIDQSIGDDMNTALGLGTDINDSALSDLLSGLDSAVSAVSGFANAAQSVINSVVGPLQLVQQRVQTLIASTGNTLLDMTTLGGILPGNPISQQVGGLLNATSAMQSLPVLYQLQSVTGRMSANLTGLSSAGGTITTAGGNLFKVAQQQYGDATDWTTIAQANNLTDPVITGQQTLSIPTQGSANGGILAT